MPAASGPLLGAGELGVAADVEQPRIAGAHRAEHLVLAREHALARMRDERRRLRTHFARLHRAALIQPLLDAALHHRHLVVAVAAQRDPKTRGVVPALGVIPDHLGVVADAEARHRRRELCRAEEHVQRVAGGGGGSREVTRPVAVHRTRQMAGEVILFRIAPDRSSDAPPRPSMRIGLDARRCSRPDSSRDVVGGSVRGNLRRGLALVRKRTQRGPALRVQLLEKEGCGLCADTYRALTRIRMDMPLEIERIDITTDVALLDRYVIRIPVLRVEARELDTAGLDDAALRRWLKDFQGSWGS